MMMVICIISFPAMLFMGLLHVMRYYAVPLVMLCYIIPSYASYGLWRIYGSP